MARTVPKNLTLAQLLANERLSSRGKAWLLKLNMQTTCPPRGSVPVNTKAWLGVLHSARPDRISVMGATAPAMSASSLAAPVFCDKDYRVADKFKRPATRSLSTYQLILISTYQPFVRVSHLFAKGLHPCLAPLHLCAFALKIGLKQCGGGIPAVPSSKIPIFLPLIFLPDSLPQTIFCLDTGCLMTHNSAQLESDLEFGASGSR